MTGLIQGKDVVIYFQKVDGYKLYGCASEISVSIDTELKSVKTKNNGSGVWKKQAQQALSYSITLNGLMKYDDNVDGWYLLNNQIQFVNINYRMIFMSGSLIKRLEGELIIQSTQLHAVPNDLVKGNFTMPGNGELKIYNDSGVCSSSIIDAVLNTSIGVDRGLYFSATTGTSYISYELYRLGVLVNTGNVSGPYFHADIIISGPKSNYSIVATPYCANDAPGEVFNKTFSTIPVLFFSGKAGVDPCYGNLTPVYGAFATGNILYTDAALSVPISGYVKLVAQNGHIYNLNKTTGVLGTDTGVVCVSIIKSNWYKIANSTSAVCSASLIRLYTAAGFGVGNIMYYDEANTSPVLGNSVILYGTEIYNMNPFNGTVTSDAFLDCPDITPTDFLVSTDVCDAAVLTYYTTGAFAIGVTIWTNSLHTIRLTGKTKFVKVSTGNIYNISPTTGIILSDTGTVCP